jgi:hypothetical protein
MAILLGAMLIAGGCAVAVGLVMRPVAIDEYAAARVRVYRIDQRGSCRVEIITATDTIQTGSTKCFAVPNRHVTGP